MNLPPFISIREKDRYELMPTSDFSGYHFTTDGGVSYQVAFVEDFTLEDFEIYQLTITVDDGTAGVRDPKIENTVVAVLETFFQYNQNGLLYICDMRDGRQASRNRLFVSWFNRFEGNTNYTLQTKRIEVDHTVYFVSLMSRNDNPQLRAMYDRFNAMYQEMVDKLDENE